MNWTMLGAVGEILGAIAVVLSLVYLARQVRDGALEQARAGLRSIGRLQPIQIRLRMTGSGRT